MSVTRVDRLTDTEKARFNEWADRWIDIGLRTGPADRAKFEAAARECYRFADIDWPGVVVWVPSPMVLALAAPASALAIAHGGRRAASSVGGAVVGAVRDFSAGTQNSTQSSIRDVISRSWSNYIGGQFWASGWYWGGAITSFFREVCDLELKDDLWDRGRAYEATIESACWWWPHRRFVMVSEHPLVIHRELINLAVTRGWGSHRLHCDTGPAVVWPDGWGLWMIHGVRVPQRVVEQPETLTPAEILAEQNAEVRRVMVQRFGEERFISESGALPIHRDKTGDLYRVDIPDDEPLVMVRVINSTQGQDGSRKPYWLRVPPTMTQAHEAVAWTFEQTTKMYAPAVES